MVNINVKETTKSDLENIMMLWNDGEVMFFVGFPNGLGITIEKLRKWLIHIESNKPLINHYSIYLNGIYCGESFYCIDMENENCALDIKLLPDARGKGIANYALNYTIDEAFKHGAKRVYVDPNLLNAKAIALYKRLGFVEKDYPKYLQNEYSSQSIYMEKICN